MYLLIDIGNTRIKWQHRDDKNIIASNSILVEEFMDLDFSSIKSIEKIIMSNVSHSVVLDKMKEILAVFKCPIIEATSDSNDYLINDYEDCKTLGVDRWMAALGAWKLYQRPLLIINAGTAITIDLINLDQKDKAHFKGGMILPGIAISLGILNNSTNLIDTEIGKSHYPSLNTKDAVTTGVMTSIQGAVNLVCKKLPSSLPILLTGGDANLIYEQSEVDWKSRIKIEEDLIFEGLLFFK
ncbi:MAG: type III pantothenate kinase [Methylophilaceae bacterium]|tara:strand:- start:1693 stop:2412 length:720 start_codon:yes stop_codon:yes gene_type:complete